MAVWLTEKEAKEFRQKEIEVARKELEHKLDQLTQSLDNMKICPILMAGTMISNIWDNVVGTEGHHLYYESVRCMGEKCEWFLNGCPAHPHPGFELECKLGTSKPLPPK